MQNADTTALLPVWAVLLRGGSLPDWRGRALTVRRSIVSARAVPFRRGSRSCPACLEPRRAALPPVREAGPGTGGGKSKNNRPRVCSRGRFQRITVDQETAVFPAGFASPILFERMNAAKPASDSPLCEARKRGCSGAASSFCNEAMGYRRREPEAFGARNRVIGSGPRPACDSPQWPRR